MKTRWIVAVAATLFVAGTGIATARSKLGSTAPAAYRNQAPPAAAKALLDIAATQTENGTWERIGVGRVLYLGGRKAEGDALFNQVMNSKDAKTSDVARVADVYMEAGEWPKARMLLDRTLTMKGSDAGDVKRVARAYEAHKEWPKAKVLFQKFVAMEDVDEKELAEVGAYFLLHGDRATAETLFDRSIAKDDKSLWSTLHMAGAYLNVKPQP